MATYAPLLCKYGYQQWAPDLIWFDTDEIVLTPSYLVQYLNMNNVGTDYLPITGEHGNGLYSSLTIDRENGKAYLKIVNTTSKRVSLSADLSAIGSIGNKARHSFIRASSITDYNDRAFTDVEIEVEEMKTKNGVIVYNMPKLSFSVIEVNFNT